MTGLNIGGWIFLIAAWTAILAITAFCAYRILFKNTSLSELNNEDKNQNQMKRTKNQSK
ncbi:MAG: hypothetical protein ONB11_09285 [candidate division KSB1 bacterium]|nr:hypothetical protein [candidate division KSB1 bacterium]MDZ7341648.1 hypothetical protein [candidate division KSB1 bacterium]